MRVRVLVSFVCALLTAVNFASADTPRKFKVGMILPLTGVTADYGVAMRNSIELAKDDNPALFTDVEFIYEDAQYDPRLAVQAFHKLRGADNVDMIYTWGVSFCLALAPLADQYDIPTVGQCVDATAGKDRKNFLRFQNYSDQYVRKQLDYLHRNGIRNIGVVLTANSYMESFYSALERLRYPDQTITLIGRYLPQEMDLRYAVTKAKASEFDAIGVLLMTGQVSQFYREAAEQRFKPYSFGTNLFESVSEIRAAKGAMDGALLVSSHIDDGFRTRYGARFGNESQLGFGSLAYEFVTMLGEVRSSRPAGLTGADALQALSLMHNRTGGAAGAFTYRDSPEVGKFFEFELQIKRVAGERFVELADLEPAPSSVQ